MPGKVVFLKYPFILLFAVALILTASTEFLQRSKPESPEEIVQKAEIKLHNKEGQVLKRLSQLTLLSSDESIKESVFNQHEDNSIYVFAYLKDSLFAWSDNDVFVSQEEGDSAASDPLLKLRNGWYEVFKADKGNYHFYAALLIKKEFAYQNKFLVNSFNPKLKIPDNYGFLIASSPGSLSLKNSEGKILCWLVPGEHASSANSFPLAAWLYMLVALMFLSAVYFFGKWLLQRSVVLAVLFAIAALGLRLLNIHLRIPEELYSTELFNPRLYASFTWMNSLGDFLINVLLVLCLLLFLKNGNWGNWVTKVIKGAPGNLITLITLIAIVLFATLVLNELMQGIVFNSAINFNTSNVFDLDIYSFTGLLIVALLILIYFVLVKALIDFQLKGNWGYRVIGVIGVSEIVLISLIAVIYQIPIAAEVVLFVLIYAGIFIFTSKEEGKRFPFSAVVLFLFITSLYSSASIYSYNKTKEQEKRKLLAGKVETEQDRVAEHLFEDVEDKIATDTLLQKYFERQTNASSLISQRLHRHYFNGFWTKYEIGSYCFDNLHRPFNKTIDSTGFDEFQSIISNVGKATYAENLFFLTQPDGKSMYLARIPVMTNDSIKLGTLFIELEPKHIQSTQGFPELFISDKVAFNKDLANYSYAKYKNGELVNQFGDFAYYFSASVFGRQDGEYTFVNRDGFNHLLYRQNTDSLTVISKKQDNIYALITSFSYFFAFFAILLLVFIVLQKLTEGRYAVSLSLKNRIQLSVIAIVIFSVTTIGVGTIYYIIKKYDVNQSVKISTQLKSLLVTIENNFDEPIKSDTTLNEDITFKLSKISANTSTDFNWYDEEGNLLFSSQPKIFDQGITSTLMNPVAFDELTEKQQTQFVHPENIGKLNYIAAYQTLRDRQNHVLGYISLPFFEKESELNRDISTFLSALINIYVLLLSLTVLITFFIASRITKPLLLIQEKLANIKLGKRNEFIQWNKRDEIGELVKEYNRKVEELALSADLLAKSERESAWHEMAKQVAHEIKNPLTPMKLGVQHLLSAYNVDSPGKEELVKKISQTLIQQIDTLSNIANEFSNFAQMPVAKNEVVDIISILSDTINLFKESPDVVISFQKNKIDSSHANVLADKDQLIRLFSNLLKNAVQSVPAERHGKIEVSITLNQGFFTVSIQDNGTGIADNQVEKIFLPNFTTKSGGMGLGLAIVKNIVENSGGKVWFDTKIGVGTIFFVTLPALNRETRVS